MHRILAWLIAAVPLVITPGLSFYFDVIPRASLLLIIAAVVLVRQRDLASRIAELCSNRLARVFCIAALLYGMSLLVSSLLSMDPALSIYGSTWRRFGMITQSALLVLTVILAVDVGRQVLLRAVVVFGCVAAIYGIFQYFGKDPLLDSSLYHVGEGVWAIVRPPGTAGHADYFAVYLVMVAFTAGAMFVSDPKREWRLFAGLMIAVAGVATILTGTRGALVGALCGLVVVVVRLRPRFTRVRVTAAGVIACALMGFYFSPAGERLRARVRWSIEDPRGGARLWLWRDSLRMAAQRPVLGFGPETYGSEFPEFQSLDLARAYPDFHHESPHNLELDILVAQGIPGVAAFVVMLGAALVAGLRAPPVDRNLATVLLGGFAAVLVSHQFCSPTVVTALCVSVTAAWLLGLAPLKIGEPSASGTVKKSRSEIHVLRYSVDSTEPRPRGSGRTTNFFTSLSGSEGWLPFGVSVGLGLVLLSYALVLSVADWFLDKTRDALAFNNTDAAAAYYERAARWLPGASADLYYSRTMAAAAAKAPDPASAVRTWQQAIVAGQRAITTSDEPANAAYNLAALHAAANDLARTEESLRTAISKAPNWFKPHWMLARVLTLAGRLEEAEAAATAAVERNGNVNPEVQQTLNEIRQRRSQGR